MPYVLIPFKSFITRWHGEENLDDSLYWIRQNVGEMNIDWDVDNCKEHSDHAIFWFAREIDAVAFKLRWV